MTNQVKDFITRCLDTNPETRLGSKADQKDILDHPWLQDINPTSYLNKEIKAPFKPVFEQLTCFDQYFDQGFVKKNPVMSFVSPLTKESVQQHQEEFEKKFD